MYPKKWYISPKKWPFAQNKFSAQDILIYVVNFREWHLRTFLSSNPQGCHNWGVGRGSSQFWQCQYLESSYYSSPLAFPICVAQKSSVNQEAKLKQFESFSQKFIFSHHTKSSCRGEQRWQKGNEKKTTRTNKRFGAESFHRRQRDTKWAATLLTTQPSKAASSGCLACHSSLVLHVTDFDFCVSLILTPFPLSLIVDCHSNNLPVTSNHLTRQLACSPATCPSYRCTALIQNYICAILSKARLL